MKRVVIALIFVVAIGISGAFGQTKNDDILKLLKITKTDKQAEQLMGMMMQQINQIAPGVPNAFWDKFRKKINTDELLQMSVPIYAKHYTHDEIKALLAFYNTPLGKKMIEVAPIITQESMVAGQKWGEKLGEDIVKELMKEGLLKQ